MVASSSELSITKFENIGSAVVSLRNFKKIIMTFWKQQNQDGTGK